MAQAMLADEVMEATTWLQTTTGNMGLSYVFKTNEVHIRDETITWKDCTRTPTDSDLEKLYRGAETSLDIRSRDDGETDIDVLTKRSVLNLIACVKRCMFELFRLKGIAPSDVSWYIQAEWSKDQLAHIHLLLWGEKVNQNNGKWWQRILCSYWSRWYTASINKQLSAGVRLQIRELIERDKWVDVLQYKHATTRKEYTKEIEVAGLIGRYFLKKEPWWLKPTSLYYCSFDSEFKTDHLSYSQRLAVAQLYEEQQKRDSAQKRSVPETTSAPERKRQRLETQKELSIKETCDQLFDQRVVSQEEWMLANPDSYVHMMAQPNGDAVIRNILDIVTLRLSKLFTAYQLVAERFTTDLSDIRHTKIWQIFTANQMNPYKVIHAIMCCLNRQMGKRNTILLWGPATTGKSLLAQALCELAGNVGCYNPANVNFPFNDCTNKNIIWCEEAGNFGQQVNQFKAICSGQTIRIDQKGKGSKQIAPTPVIMTTNEDITEVRIGCETKPEHTQPIRDRMLNLHLHNKLKGDFGLLEKTEWADVFKWMSDNGFKPTLASYIHWWDTAPTWEERWDLPDPAFTDSQLSVLTEQPHRQLSVTADIHHEPQTQALTEVTDLVNAWVQDERTSSSDLFGLSSENGSQNPAVVSENATN